MPRFFFPKINDTGGKCLAHAFRLTVFQGGSCKTSRGMGVSPMKHGQDARATLDHSRFCKSLRGSSFGVFVLE